MDILQTCTAEAVLSRAEEFKGGFWEEHTPRITTEQNEIIDKDQPPLVSIHNIVEIKPNLAAFRIVSKHGWSTQESGLGSTNWQYLGPCEFAPHLPETKMEVFPDGRIRLEINSYMGTIIKILYPRDYPNLPPAFDILKKPQPY